MRLLLIGCTGFIGKELVPSLLKEGHEIYIVSRKEISEINLNIDIKNFKFLKIDLSLEKNWQNKDLVNILKESDGILNLIGEPIADKKWTIQQKRRSKIAEFIQQDF